MIEVAQGRIQGIGIVICLIVSQAEPGGQQCPDNCRNNQQVKDRVTGGGTGFQEELFIFGLTVIVRN